MSYLIDTNVLLRLRRHASPDYIVASTAVTRLALRAETLYVSSQNLIEFWNVATRPLNRNGFGLMPAQAFQELTWLEGHFSLLTDTSAVYHEWRQLVLAIGVSGVQVHDARLVAIMQVYQIPCLLTFNVGDFVRYPNISPVHPKDIT